MKNLLAKLERVCLGFALVGFAGLTVVALVSLADVVLRTAGLPRVPGLFDIREVCFAVIVASCFPLGLIEGNHVTVRILGKLLGTNAGRLLERIAATLTLAFFGVALVAFWLVADDLARAGRTTFSLELPMAPWLWTIALMLAVCVIVQSVVLLSLFVAPGEAERTRPPATRA